MIQEIIAKYSSDINEKKETIFKYVLVQLFGKVDLSKKQISKITRYDYNSIGYIREVYYYAKGTKDEMMLMDFKINFGGQDYWKEIELIKLPSYTISSCVDLTPLINEKYKT